MKNIEWRHVTWYSQLFAIILFLDVFGLGFWLGLQVQASKIELQDATVRQTAMAARLVARPEMNGVIATASYMCADGKKIQAEFLSNSVNLSLSDGRTMNLLQAISAAGGRYTNSDELFVFWSKGTSAFITESGKATYSNCVESKMGA